MALIDKGIIKIKKGLRSNDSRVIQKIEEESREVKVGGRGETWIQRLVGRVRRGVKGNFERLMFDAKRWRKRNFRKTKEEVLQVKVEGKRAGKVTLLYSIVDYKFDFERGVEDKKRCRCVVKTTKTNVFVNMQDVKGLIFHELTAGKAGYKDMRKKTVHAGIGVGKAMGEVAMKEKYRRVDVIVVGQFDKKAQGVLLGIAAAGLKIKNIEVKGKVAHNGVRMRKRRRK